MSCREIINIQCGQVRVERRDIGAHSLIVLLPLLLGIALNWPSATSIMRYIFISRALHTYYAATMTLLLTGRKSGALSFLKLTAET